MTAVTAPSSSRLAGLQIVVTSGGTQQPLDDVRFITNASTGNTGARIAEECMRRGAHVHYVHGRGAHLPFRRSVQIDLRSGYAGAVAALRDLQFEAIPGEARCYEVRAVEDLMACLRELLEAGDKAMVVQAMAVSDYTAPTQRGKISSDQDELLIRLERTPKVIAHLKEWAPQIVQIGFKLLSGVSREELYAVGLASGRAYHSDLTIANDQQEITVDRHPVLAIWPDGAAEYIVHDMPRRVVDLLEEGLARRGVSGGQGSPDDRQTAGLGHAPGPREEAEQHDGTRQRGGAAG